MKEIFSLPDKFDNFLDLVKARYEEVKTGYSIEDAVISRDTLIAAYNMYTREERDELSKFLVDNGINAINPFTGGDTWSRFEEFHYPCSQQTENYKPYRPSKDDNVFFIRSVKDIDFSPERDTYFIHTGYKLILPKGCIALMSSCCPGLNVVTGVATPFNLKGELCVLVDHIDPEFSKLNAGQVYLMVVLIKGERLMTDNVFNVDKVKK